MTAPRWVDPLLLLVYVVGIVLMVAGVVTGSTGRIFIGIGLIASGPWLNLVAPRRPARLSGLDLYGEMVATRENLRQLDPEFAARLDWLVPLSGPLSDRPK